MPANEPRSRLQSRQPFAPEFDADGFFGIRLESIGGLGAHLAGQLLAEAAVLRQGLNGSHFSSYGSEKKGSPVKSYVRICPPDRLVRTSSPVDRPNVIAIFHEALAGDRGIVSGLSSQGVVIVNTKSRPQEIRPRLNVGGAAVGAVDAMGIAVEEGSRVNTAMLGAVARVCSFLALEAVEETIRATFEHKYPHLVDANIRTFRRGHDELELDIWSGDDVAASPGPPSQAPAFGYLDAPIGGTIMTPGNSILKDLTASRQGFVPAFDRSRCVDCGLCDLVCPDFCLVWNEEDAADGRHFIRLRGIDYRYCKGCLKCVDACPTPALTAIREEDGYAKAHTVPLYPWLNGQPPSAPAPKPGRNGAAKVIP